jgi:hypothetical protein
MSAESSEPFFNPQSKQAQVATVFMRLDSQDDDLKELKAEMKAIKKLVYQINTQYKILITLGSMLLVIGTVLGWLLSNKYLVIQLPH